MYSCAEPWALLVPDGGCVAGHAEEDRATTPATAHSEVVSKREKGKRVQTECAVAAAETNWGARLASFLGVDVSHHAAPNTVVYQPLDYYVNSFRLHGPE